MPGMTDFSSNLPVDAQSNQQPSDRLTLGLMPTAPAGFRSGFVGIVGRPNVGKSTLMNELVGQKIAITSPVAQTTRNRLRGILTTDTAQIIFVDTPGIHKPQHQLGEVLVKNAQSAMRSVDVVLFVVDSAVPLGKGDRFIAELLSTCTAPVVLGLNKADQQASQSPETYANIDQTYHALAQERNWAIAKFSALARTGLEVLQEKLIHQLDPGPYYYPPDLVTDQPERFIMGELIREQILLLTREEVPHSTAVIIDRVEEEPKITRVLATVYVERPSQKGIMIGKNGSMMKAIGSAARQQIQKLIDGNVYLELFVKVQPKWRQSRSQLADLGYHAEE
jgi:GTPase